ncbi:hypothetical protein PCE1_001066 [Barthelona sp. PCE]
MISKTGNTQYGSKMTVKKLPSLEGHSFRSFTIPKRTRTRTDAQQQKIITCEPKVFAPYKHKPGEVPRRVLIERLSREYAELAANLNAVLAEAGIFLVEPTQEQLDDLKAHDLPVIWQPSMKAWLPLSFFDNDDYNERSWEEWYDLGFDDGEGKHFVPVKVFVHFNWLDGRAYAYDSKKKEFTVVISGKTFHLTRDQCLIMGENPLRFVERLRNMYMTRHETELHLKYTLYISKMPLDNLPLIDQEKLKAVLNRALEGIDISFYDIFGQPRSIPSVSKSIKKISPNAYNSLQINIEERTKELLKDLQLDFAQLENSLILKKLLDDDNFLKNFNDESLVEIAHLINAPKPKPLPVDRDSIPITREEYEDARDSFVKKSFFTKPECVEVLAKLYNENHRLQEHLQFFLVSNKTFHVEEFASIQSTTLTNAKVFLTDNYLSAVRSHLLNTLKNVKIGWFSAANLQPNIFKHSRMADFIRTLNFVCQDVLRRLLLNNINKYRDWIVRVQNFVPLISDTNDVKVTLMDNSIRSAPLFVVKLEVKKATHDENFSSFEQYTEFITAINESFDLPLDEDDGMMDDDGEDEPLVKPDITSEISEKEYPDYVEMETTAIDYDVPLTLFEGMPLKVFDNVLASLVDLPKIETLVMSTQFLNEDTLDCIGIIDVEAQRDEIGRAMGSLLVPLKRYLQTFNKYSKFMTLPTSLFQRYLKTNYESLDLVLLKERVSKLRAEKQALYNDIQESINLGGVQVNCSSVRQHLEKKYDVLIEALLQCIVQKATALCSEIGSQYEGFYKKLIERPRSIEHLTEIKEFQTSIVSHEDVLSEKMDTMVKIYEQLEKLSYCFSDSEFALRWKIFSWPRNLENVAAKNLVLFEKYEEKFRKELKKGQESFQRKVQDVSLIVGNFHQNIDPAKTAEYAAEIKRLLSELKSAGQQSKDFNTREGLLSINKTNYNDVKVLQEAFQPFADLWLTAQNWDDWWKLWNSEAFSDLNAIEMEEQVMSAFKTIKKSVKGLSEHPACAEIAVTTKEKIEEFVPHIPLLQALRGPGMRERHWKELSLELGFELNPDEDDSFTLRDFFSLNLPSHELAIFKVTDYASKEFMIEEALSKMKEAWEGMEFFINPYHDTYTMGGIEDVMTLLDDHIVTTQAMSFSPFKKPFEEEIAEWEALLKSTSDIIEEWCVVQASWMYLEPIFSSADIIRQLPREYKTFSSVDHTWRRLMNIANRNPDCLAFCSQEKLLSKFKECTELLDQVQKGLADYLESKRAVFARFYFLSDDDLLMILSQTKDPTAVQPHLRKCFDNIHKIEFVENNEMVAMFSGEGERVPFKDGVFPTEFVENWMCDIEEMMKASVHHVISQAISAYYEMPREEWVLAFPAQVVLIVSAVMWTRENELAIEEQACEAQAEKQRKQIFALTNLVRGKLSRVHRTGIGALLTLDVHSRDVTDELIQHKVGDIRDFNWISQLRTYWDNDDIYIRMVQSNVRYKYEYLGATSILVTTPLTRLIRVTLFNAIHFQLGGSPQGPAGTGKTETVKDLGKIVGSQVIVMNCQEGLTVFSFERLFLGLVQTGAWSCFDEFNRIDIEVLSVIAQQLSTIYQSIRQGLKKFVFAGVEVKLDPTCGVFITMNPGYAGRTELPDNLKAQFRPIAVMVPDYALIAEVRLFSFGFKEGKNLARKMVSTFRLSSEQLSSQSHYDFGMRAVNTVISAAGKLKRESPDQNEEIVLLRALRDCNLPKFLADDLPLFNGIISDLFPNTKIPSIDYGLLQQSIFESIAERNLQPTEDFVQKVIQLFDTTVLRHGLMLVGPTGGGKTECLHTLATSLTKLKDSDDFYKVHILTLNPKSISMDQLYGGRDKNTQEWYDGVLAKNIRTAAQNESDDHFYICCDGPVDALWIENMNTVLDDNKKLCLPSGQIIPLTDRMNIIFEVEDLAVASPATVSRCGMVYLEPIHIGFKAWIDSWISTLPENFVQFRPIIQRIFTGLIEPCVDFVKRSCNELIPAVASNLIQSCFRLFDSFIKNYQPVDEVTPVPQEVLDRIPNILDALLVFSVLWSVGASIDGASRKKFDVFFRNLIPQHCKCTLPSDEKTLYSYKFDEENNSWVLWEDTVEPFKADSKSSVSDLIIPVPETIALQYVMKILNENRQNILSVGETGTSKSVSIKQNLVNQIDGNTFIPLFVTFSAQTSANQTQDILDSKFEKRRTVYFGPPLGKHMIIFVDDLNMPKREEYGAQPPIELVRQWMDHGGWYDRKALYLRHIIDVHFVSAMGPPGGGRNPVTDRLLRHFNFLCFPVLSNESLFTIYNSIIGHFFASNKFSENLMDIQGDIIKASVKLYNTVCDNMLPTPDKSHYTFNLRDLSSVIQGICMCHPQSLSNSPDTLIRLWAHENMRVFGDRLTNDDDRVFISKKIAEIVRTDLNNDIKRLVPEYEPEKPLRLFFGGITDDLAYREVTDVKQLQKRIENRLVDYNEEESHKMNLVMFTNAIEHILRIYRIITSPEGNALLLGVGGSGRQSLTRLSVFIAKYELFTITVTKGFGMTEWRENIMQLLKSCGLDEKNTVFLLTDAQIQTEQMLEDVSNILNIGEVPNLFDETELDQIYQTMRPVAREQGITPTKLNLYSLFVSRIKQHIHVVLCMSPKSALFRQRLRQFPSLVNCCTIDWFTEWPREALESVARGKLVQMESSVIEFCVHVHQTVSDLSQDYFNKLGRHNYVTPISYLELLSMVELLFKDQADKLKRAKHRYTKGLDIINETEVQIEILRKRFEKLIPELQTKSEELTVIIGNLNIKKEEVRKKREEIEKQEIVAQKNAAECAAIKEDAEADLEQVRPAFEAAQNRVKQIDPRMLTELGSFLRPPETVKTCMQAVCILLDKKPRRVPDPSGVPGKYIREYWGPAQELLRKPRDLLDRLLNYDTKNLTDEIVQKVRVFREDPTFNEKEMQKVSMAAATLSVWVCSVYDFHVVAKEVEPKERALAEAKAELDIIMSKLKGLREELDALEEQIQSLESSLEEQNSFKVKLEKDVENTQKKLKRAEKLLTSLADERKRWKEEVVELEKLEVCLTGDVLLCAAFISYLGAFTNDYRKQLVQSWFEKLAEVNINCSSRFSLQRTLGDANETRNWNMNGLPYDEFSIDNAIIMNNTERWPLLIDPQSQANRWIRNTYGADSIEVVNINNTDEKTVMRKLENCIRFGKKFLLENLSSNIPSYLNSILLRQITYEKGKVPMIKLGDHMISYNSDFQLFLTTKLFNPHYSPEIQSKVTLLNFSITFQGLRDQILSKIVIEEKPELEKLKNRLIKDTFQMKCNLKEIEDDILRILENTSQEAILEDDKAIDVLAGSKKVSIQVQEKVREAEITEKEIDHARSQYIPISIRATILYFCVVDMSAADPMYQYSLQWFLRLFVSSIHNSPKSEDLQERIVSLTDFFTYSLYENICRSLFEVHKLMFSFLMSVRIKMNRNELDNREWRYLISGLAMDPNHPNPDPSFITDGMWQEICAVSQLPRFEKYVHDWLNNTATWRKLFDSNDVHEVTLPAPFDEMDAFGRLLILRTFRPDKVVPAIQAFVTSNLDGRFIVPPTFDLTGSYRDSSALTPLVFVLSPGADPAQDLFAFAEQMHMRHKLSHISLGQGQGPKAAKMIEAAAESGSWVLLQNCHLSSSWMPELERIVDSFNPDRIRPEFRLWLTSMPSKEFPVSILMNSVKMTLEPPKGLRNNLLRSYVSFDDALFNHPTKPVEFNHLLFSLSFFHAAIQERRKFGALGWNIPYEFNQSDLSICVKQLSYFLEHYDDIPFEVLRFLCGQINYGGRVTDVWDKRTIQTIITTLIDENVLNESWDLVNSIVDNDGTYRVVSSLEKTDYVSFIESLPLNAEPSVFGLHQNGDITHMTNETFHMFDTLITLQPSDSGGAGGDRNDKIDSLAKDIASRVSPVFDIEAIQARYPTRYEESMNTVLQQEAIRYNRLLKVLHRSLDELRRALKGEVVLSQELEEVANNLFNNQVPTLWTKVAYPSLKPLSAWVSDLIVRCNFINNWYEQGPPVIYWMSGFFFPQAFITGTLQNFARKYVISIDTISFSFTIMDAARPTTPPEDGVYVDGLFLEGARWDPKSHSLVEAKPKELFSEFPVIQLLPLSNRIKPKEGIYNCPLFKTAKRAGTLSTTGHSTNFVTTIEVPSTSEGEAHWIKRGTALLCSLRF